MPTTLGNTSASNNIDAPLTSGLMQPIEKETCPHGALVHECLVFDCTHYPKFASPEKDWRIEQMPIPVKYFLEKGEYDQGDRAIIDYDDLYDFLSQQEQELKQRMKESILNIKNEGLYFEDKESVEGFRELTIKIIEEL